MPFPWSTAAHLQTRLSQSLGDTHAQSHRASEKRSTILRDENYLTRSIYQAYFFAASDFDWSHCIDFLKSNNSLAAASY